MSPEQQEACKAMLSLNGLGEITIFAEVAMNIPGMPRNVPPATKFGAFIMVLQNDPHLICGIVAEVKNVLNNSKGVQQ